MSTTSSDSGYTSTNLAVVPLKRETQIDFVNALAGLLGPPRVLNRPEDLDHYSKTTLPVSTRPIAIVRPTSSKEVASIIRCCRDFRIPWHAISRGKNWGYGDACAPNDGWLIVDLREMNQIVEINEQLGYAVIEPGVTQGQLAEALQNRNSSLMLDVTGAGPDASIVGNVLQRGFGHTPYGDRFANSCNFEAIDADGNLSRTGFGEVAESVVGHVYPYGVGPDKRGMYAQSHEAIITRMTIWLMPRPESVVGFGFKTDSPAKFASILDRIADLRMSGTIDSVVHMANDLRVLSTNPIVESLGQRDRPLNLVERQSLASRAGIGAWNGLGGLYGTHNMVAAKKRELKRALGGVCRVRFFSGRQIKHLRSIAKRLPFQQLSNLVESVSSVYDLLNGIPSPKHLDGAFFRNRPESGQVIDAGLIWIAPVIPCQGADALRMVDSLEPIANRFGFDLPITISPTVPRSAICIANLSFDKSNHDEVRRAQGCYREIKSEMERLGFPAYRHASVDSFVGDTLEQS